MQFASVPDRAPGWVYVMVNADLIAAGKVKIGKTELAPEERAKQLSADTSCTMPLVVHCAVRTDWHHAAEKYVHAALDAHRPNKKREFFSLTPEMAALHVRALVNEFDRDYLAQDASAANARSDHYAQKMMEAEDECDDLHGKLAKLNQQYSHACVSIGQERELVRKWATAHDRESKRREKLESSLATVRALLAKACKERDAAMKAARGPSELNSMIANWKKKWAL